MTQPHNHLSWRPRHNRPFRWLPRQGEPLCIAEWVSQNVVKIIAFLPVYTAIIVTIMLYILIFGVPFVGGG
jgi:hypothetical protein